MWERERERGREDAGCAHWQFPHQEELSDASAFLCMMRAKQGMTNEGHTWALAFDSFKRINTMGLLQNLVSCLPRKHFKESYRHPEIRLGWKWYWIKSHYRGPPIWPGPLESSQPSLPLQLYTRYKAALYLSFPNKAFLQYTAISSVKKIEESSKLARDVINIVMYSR